MENTIKKITDRQTNKVSFFKDGNKVYPTSISGNQCEFECGTIVLI